MRPRFFSRHALWIIPSVTVLATAPFVIAKVRSGSTVTTPSSPVSGSSTQVDSDPDKKVNEEAAERAHASAPGSEATAARDPDRGLSEEMKEQLKKNPGWVDEKMEATENQEHQEADHDRSPESGSSHDIESAETAQKQAAEKAQAERIENAEKAEIDSMNDNERNEAKQFVEAHENDVIHPDSHHSDDLDSHRGQGAEHSHAPEVEHEGAIASQASVGAGHGDH